MQRFLESLSQSHDWRLIVLAATVCVVGLSAAFWLMNRAWTWGGDRGRRPGLLAAVTATGAVWTTHCLIMQSYVVAIDAHVAYAPLPTLASFLLCAASVGLAIAVTFREDSRRMKAIGGGLGLLGVGVMHYVGLAGLRASATLQWNPWLIALSFVAAVALSTGAGFAYRRGPRRSLAVLALSTPPPSCCCICWGCRR